MRKWVKNKDVKNMDRHNLIVNYYTDKNVERTEELDYCILENLKNEMFDKVVLMCNEADYNKLYAKCGNGFDFGFSERVVPIITDARPSYNDYFRIITKLFSEPNNINIVANLDIIIPKETLTYLRFYMPTNKTCLALTRWDVVNKNDYRYGSTFFDRPDSQDVWIFIGGVPQIAGATFSLGIAGCDNSIAHFLEQGGYNVLNPSRTLKTFHLHLTGVRNYISNFGQQIERVPPPYKLLPPTL